MLLPLVSIAAALIISLICTPFARKLAIRYKIVALPNHRTIHNNTTPKLGGLSIYLAFASALIILAVYDQPMSDFGGLLLGGGVVLFVGLFDDILGLSCYRKIIGQTIAAIVAVYFGFVAETVYLPSGESLSLGLWALPLSLFWIVGITNAVNLLDGLDGLATGFTIIISMFICAGAVMSQNYDLAVVSVILIATCSGFLKYNFSPAKIFLGDMGSLFLGFLLACLSLKAFVVPGSGVHTLVLLGIFMIPLADTFLSIFRRLGNGRHPFWADKQHIHHRLLDAGMKQVTAVLVIYGATILCGVAGLLYFATNIQIGILLYAGLALLFLVALGHLHCFDFLKTKVTYKKPEEVHLQKHAD